MFVRDNRTGAVERIFEGAQLEAISRDGRYVSAGDFASLSRPWESLGHCFIRDRQTGLADCVYPAGGATSVSGTARFVAFG